MTHRPRYALIIVSLLVLLTPFFSHAVSETAEELRNQISLRADSIEQLQQEIASYQSELNVLGKSSNTLQTVIKELDVNRKKLTLEITLTGKKIENANTKIKSLSGEISQKDKSLNYNKEALKQSVREINELDSANITASLLGGRTMTDVWNSIDRINVVQVSLKQHADDVRVIKTGLLADRTDQELAKEDLLELQGTLGDQKKILDANAAEKNRLLKETQNKQSNYQALVNQKASLVKAFEAEMQNYESRLQYVLDPSKFPTRGSRVLGWPLDQVLVTQMFGKTVDAVRLYASGSHSGTDFRASVGTPVYAMANGVVMGAGDTDVQCKGASFGKWVLIKYDNGLAAAFGHLSLIKAQKGDRVTARTVIAYSGNTGRSTAPHLHISMYVGDAVEASPKPSFSCKGKILTQPTAPTNAYLDPLSYMPLTTAGMFK